MEYSENRYLSWSLYVVSYWLVWLLDYYDSSDEWDDPKLYTLSQTVPFNPILMPMTAYTTSIDHRDIFTFPNVNLLTKKLVSYEKFPTMRLDYAF